MYSPLCCIVIRAISLSSRPLIARLFRMCALIVYRCYNRGDDLCNFCCGFKNFLPALEYLANFFLPTHGKPAPFLQTQLNDTYPSYPFGYLMSSSGRSLGFVIFTAMIAL